MASMDQVANSVVSAFTDSVHEASISVVKDAFRLVIAPEEEYVESDVAIELLEFAGNVVGGMGAAAQTPQEGVRATSRITIPLSDSSGGTAAAAQDITLYGPGDVQGIDPGQIIRRYPAPGTMTAEETVLAHIEFDRPELPWAFSATSVSATMRPWLTLVVVETGHVTWHPATGTLPVIEVPVAELPALGNAHLWAHAQVTQSQKASIETRMSPEYARVNLSRLLSPRILKEDTTYLAAVVPTLDVGAQGGRGLSAGTLDWSWSGTDGTVVLPVYDSWEFRTGPDGDFATIALRLKGVVAPYEVGRRFIDASEPGRPMTSLPDGASGDKQVLRCALYSPTPPPPERVAAETAEWPAGKTQELRQQLDLPAQLEGEQEHTGTIPDLPVVGPRIYGSNHRASHVITGSDWFAELNLSPRHRIVGGLGTRVIQRDQEQLMQAAWLQVGEVEKANRAIALAELAELLGSRLHQRVTSFIPSHLAQVAAPMATRISLTPGTTLAADIAASATPPAAFTGAFRRTVRPTGPMLRHTSAATQERVSSILGEAGNLRDFTRTYANPDGVRGLSAATIAELDQAVAARVLGVGVDTLQSELRTATDAIKGGIIAHLQNPAVWQTPQGGRGLGAGVAERWGEAVLRETSIPAVSKIRQERVAGLVAELATSKVADTLTMSTQLIEQAQTLNNVLAQRFAAPERVEPSRGRTGSGGGSGTVRVGRGTNRIDPHDVRANPSIGRIDSGVERIDPTRLSNTLRRSGDVTPVFDVAAVSRLKILTDRSDARAKREAFLELAKTATVPISPVLDKIDTLSVDTMRAAIPVLFDPGQVMSIAQVPRRDTLAVADLSAALKPASTVRPALLGRLTLSEDILKRIVTPERIRRIMAAPTFNRPMYQALADYSREWLVPGLGMLPDADFVTVLATNPQFMEAFLVGLSEEMGRELLWRGYPTDQSGTYFRRFWDDAQDELSQQIHAFLKTPLGSHIAFGGTGGNEPRAVIVVKSELVRRYPDVIIQAVKNHGTQAEPQFDGPQAVVAEELFSAFLEPDFALVGVNLSIEEIDKPAWWITIAEHPTATRFDRPRDANISSTATFLTVPGAASGAEYAKKRLHNPTRVAFHATDLVTRGA